MSVRCAAVSGCNYVRCFYPITAFQDESGQIGFKEGPKTRRKLTLRCGRCIGCRTTRAREWQLRLIHESKTHSVSSFVTLTYSPPCNPSLEYTDVQLFFRRLRRTGRRFRYFVSGEYGDVDKRPHWHLILFGVHFADRQVWKTGGGYPLYRSLELERLWPHGFSTIGNFTSETAAYCAHYVIKKIGGVDAETHYKHVDTRTGEECVVEPEFARMSLKPRIGDRWLRLYAEEVFDNDSVVLGGREVPVPRSYTALLKKEAPDWAADLEFRRYMKSLKFEDKDWTRDRLRVKEECAIAKLKTKKGSL